MVDNKDDFASVVTEKLFRKCSASWESYQYLRDRVHLAGYLTARASSCDGLSGGFRCKTSSNWPSLFIVRSSVHLHIFQGGILDTQKPGMPMKHHPLWVARAGDPVRV
jgi:hypothetical protein